MNVCLASYQSVMLLRGGPRTQILETKKCLEKLGIRVTLFDPWCNFNAAEFDIVHIFGANIGSYHLAREIYKLGVPIAVTPIFFSLHTMNYLRTALLVDRFIRKFYKGFWIDYGLLRDICKWSKGVLPNTQKEANLIVDGIGIPRNKVTVVPNGADGRFLNADRELFIKKYGFEDFILNVGHIGPERKNVQALIEALSLIDAPSVIIGRIEESPDGRKCIEAARKNPRLTVIDSLPNDSDLLSSAYAACAVFVLPSLFETPGIAALEAALAGAKIVITKYGGTEEYFGDRAEYVDPASPRDIRRGILTSLRKEKENLLRMHINREFTWEIVAQHTLNVYENILSGRQ